MPKVQLNKQINSYQQTCAPLNLIAAQRTIPLAGN